MKSKSSEGKLELNSSLFCSSASPGISIKESVMLLSQKLLGLWGGREREHLLSACSGPGTMGPCT